MIIVKIGRKYSFIRTDEIKWIESEKGYLKIYVGNEHYLVTMSLKGIKKKLDSENFIRINRSNIINVSMIKEMIGSDNSKDYKVILKDKTVLKWGRRYRTNFPDRLLVN